MKKIVLIFLIIIIILKSFFLIKNFIFNWNSEYFIYSDENFRQKIIFKNDTKLLLEAGNNTHEWCRDWKTILEKNWKQKIIIDDIKYSEYRNLCSVYAKVINNENVGLFVCYAWWAWSWECQSLVFNLNIDTEKLTFVWDYYYIPERPFNFWFFEEYFEKYKTKKEQKEYLKDLKNTDKSELETNIKWHNEFLEKEKIIKEYFKKEHNIDNIVFEDEFFKEFFKNLK